MALANPYNYKKPRNFVKPVQPVKAKKEFNETQPKANKHDAYLEQKVMSAKPEELTLMLYEGVVKFVKRAKLFNDMKDVEKTNNAILRAEAIIDELRQTLNMEFEISHQLDSLYEFMNRRLFEANVQKDNVILDEVLTLSEEMRDTWKQAMDSLK